jgi:hypothetical protein
MMSVKHVFKRMNPPKTRSKKISNYYKLHADPSAGLSNQLVNKLGRLACSRENFAGVFSADRIPPLLAGRPHFIIIVNLGKHGTGFTGHFIAIIATPNRIQYMDPYGMKCVQPDVKRFLNNCGRPVRHNRRQFQALESVYCGLFSLLFAAHADKRQRGTLPSKFKLRFFRQKKKLRDNDDLCARYLHEIIKYD